MKFRREPTPRAQKWWFSTPPSCQTGGHIVCIKGIPWHHYWDPLGTDDYDFYTHPYWHCDIDFPVILTQNCHGKRMVIPLCKWIWILKWNDCRVSRKKIMYTIHDLYLTGVWHTGLYSLLSRNCWASIWCVNNSEDFSHVLGKNEIWCKTSSPISLLTSIT